MLTQDQLPGIGLSDDLVISQTRYWLKTVVVANNFCPFARSAMSSASIRYAVVRTDWMDQCLEDVVVECVRLDADRQIETTLLIYPDGLGDFEDYLLFLDAAESHLVERGYEGTYQLASFHPEYIFEETADDDPGNYTNRSPYPMLHLLREESIERTLKSFPDPENIPQRNVALARRMGQAKLGAMLKACFSARSSE